VSKGSKRRPPSVTHEEFQKNWERIFGKAPKTRRPRKKTARKPAA